MIIFDLDGTLADCSHRRHFVDPSKHPDWVELGNRKIKNFVHIEDRTYRKKFIPDWKSFYEACDKDMPIQATCEILHNMFALEKHVQIWSGRCESVRDKTEKWLLENVKMKYCTRFDPSKHLKMRPISDYSPDEQLKERWLDEYLKSMWPPLTPDFKEGEIIYRKDPIEFVFESCPKAINMWRRRGIFVFNCSQSGEEF